MDGLTEKQLRFVEAMLLEPDAKAAYIKAGYKARGSSAEANASRLLRNAKVKNALREARTSRSERTQVSADRVVKELARIAFTDMRSYVKWGAGGVTFIDSDELSEDDGAAVTEVSESFGENGRTLKFKLAHKDSALKMLAQHLGLFDTAGRDLSEKFGAFLEGVEHATQGAPDMRE